MEQAFQFVLENWPTLLVIVYGLLNVANAVTSLTKTEKDNKVVKTIKEWVDRLAALTPGDAAGTLKAPLTRSKKQ